MADVHSFEDFEDWYWSDSEADWEPERGYVILNNYDENGDEYIFVRFQDAEGEWHDYEVDFRDYDDLRDFLDENDIDYTVYE